LPPRDPIVLYSVSSWLAYAISEKYYGGIHYAWCSTCFDARVDPIYGHAVPPSSNPCELYYSLDAEASRGDGKGAKISANRLGLLRGISARRAQGVIDSGVEETLRGVVLQAQARDFTPLLYVIPYALARGDIRVADLGERAHAFAPEYIAEALPRKCFDVLRFRLSCP